MAEVIIFSELLNFLKCCTDDSDRQTLRDFLECRNITYTNCQKNINVSYKKGYFEKFNNIFSSD